MEVEGNELMIECAYVRDWYGYSDVAVIDLSSIRGEVGTQEVNQGNTTEESDIQITSEIAGDNYELFCSNQSETYRLTNTGSITRYEPEEPIGFILSPSGGKVLFNVITGHGEMPSGPLLIVNIDGTNQQQLHPSISFWYLNWEWIGDRLLYIGHSVEDGTHSLFLVDSNDNIPELVVENVNQFYVIRRNQQ